ncbi:methyltransferase, FxLD system [Actinocorallia longicatena]
MGTEKDTASDSAALRAAMVERLRQRGVLHDPQVEAAMLAVPRHQFLPEVSIERAYSGESVVTHRDEKGAATSSASESAIIATMLEMLQLRPGQHVLEIGAGTGYNAALLSHLVGPEGRVTTVDIDPDVTAEAARHLRESGYTSVEVVTGDGEVGHAATAPFDRIVATAGAWDVPAAWKEQLAPDGLIVVPLRLRGLTRAVALRREGEIWRSTGMTECGFMPMRGAGAGTGVEQQTRLTGDAGVWIRTDEGLHAHPERLGAALATSPVVEWTGVVTRTVDDLDLWLSAQPGFSRLIVSREAVEGGLVDPIYPWGSMAVITDDSLAYVLQRPAGVNADGKPTIELGIAAYGPRDRELTDQVTERIGAWKKERTALGHVWIELHAAEGPVPDGLLIIPKRDSRVVVRAR